MFPPPTTPFWGRAARAFTSGSKTSSHAKAYWTLRSLSASHKGAIAEVISSIARSDNFLSGEARVLSLPSASRLKRVRP